MITIPSVVIQHFARKKVIPDEKAQILFAELEVFLSSAASSCRVPSKEVDEAWHEFILFTRQYADYCIKKFGRFIHHVPDMPLEGEDPNPDLSKCSNCSSDCSK